MEGRPRPFTIACPTSFGGACIEQPAPGERLDALGDRLMYRVGYRNFGNREALVLNHSVQQPGAPTDGPVAVRWGHLRPLGRLQRDDGRPGQDCAFWYSRQYMATTGDFNWRTRIADFKFINCK